MKQVTLFSHLLLETKNAASTIKTNSFDVDFISIVGLLFFFTNTFYESLLIFADFKFNFTSQNKTTKRKKKNRGKRNKGKAKIQASK